MYTTAFDTRSNRPRAVVSSSATALPRIYHYETFAGTKGPRLDETPKKVPPSPQKAPASVKKVKTAAKAVHRLTTYWDVAAHYNALEYLRKKNIRIVEGPKFVNFLISLLLMFALCTAYMAVTSENHNPVSTISSYLTNIFSSPANSTLDQIRKEAARQYDKQHQHDPTTNSPYSDTPSHSHTPSHFPSSSSPSYNRLYEEQLEKYVKEDLVRLENQMKRMSEEHTQKMHELTNSMESKTRSLENQQKKFVSESHEALTNIGKTEQSFAEVKKDLTSQIERLQAELAKVSSKPSTGVVNPKEISELQSLIDKLQKQKDADDADKQKVITALQSQIQQLQGELSKVKPVDNSKEIEELRAQVQKLEKELAEHKRAKPPAAAVPELGALKAEIAKGVHALIQADTTGRVDYALLNLGARIVPERTSASYSRTTAGIFGDYWPLSHYFKEPSVILTQEVTPGECWSMKGSFGHATVKLAEPTVPGAVTIDHISPLVSPDISSAPREFSVLGLKDGNDEGTLLGTFAYDVHALETVQTFEIKDNQVTYPLVMLSILSNHGNPNYTCIYRFRVHPRKE